MHNFSVSANKTNILSSLYRRKRITYHRLANILLNRCRLFVTVSGVPNDAKSVGNTNVPLPRDNMAFSI